MHNIEPVPVTDKDFRSFKVGSRLFICSTLGSIGWKLVEIFPPSGLCTRCIAHGEKDPLKVVQDYLEVESSKIQNAPEKRTKKDGISLQKPADGKNAKPANRRS